MKGYWPFSGFYIPETLQKRLFKFLLKRAIGQFLKNEFNLANLDVQLGKGQIQLRSLELDAEVCCLYPCGLESFVILNDG
jgi:hypothetical protein